MKPNNFGGVPTGVGGSGGGGTGGSAGGDLGGTLPGPTVIGIDGKAIAAPGTEANGDTLVYNSGTGEWDFAPGGGGSASPLTTKGDLWGYSTVDDRVPIDSNGKVLTADSANARGVSWQTIAAQPALAIATYVPGSQQIYSCTSATFADVDATNLAITFTAPASGKVIVAATVWVDGSASTLRGHLGLRESTTDIGTPVTVARDAEPGYLVTARWYLTGVTAGSHTYKLSFARATTGTFRIIVFNGAVGNFPAAMLTVEQADAAVATAGTSFPGSPTTGQRFFRTDRGLDYYYDGTRWLTVNEYSARLVITDGLQATNNAPITSAPVDEGDNGAYATRFVCWTFQNTGNATNFVTWQLVSRTATGTVHNLGASFNTSADTAATLVRHTVTIGSVVTSGDTNYRTNGTKTNLPTGLYIDGTLFYRLIG